MRPTLNPDTVWQQCTQWDAKEVFHFSQQIQTAQISVPKSEKAPVIKTVANIPPHYIHTSIVYPDENEYSCDEIDIANSIDPQSIQQLDLRKNINNTKNYARQYDLLNGQQYSSEYYDKKVQLLQRPLLRVFMRAAENDHRFDRAFRPSKIYKQKRQKKKIDAPEFSNAKSVLYLENQLALSIILAIKQREQLKLKLLQTQKCLFEEEPQPIVETQTYWDSTKPQQILQQLRELKAVRDEEEESSREQRNKLFDQCHSSDCAYQLEQFGLTVPLIEFMDEQFNQIKDRMIIWPKQPTIIKENYVDQYTKLGQHLNNNQIIHTNLERTIIIQDRTKKNKKKIKLMMVLGKKSSVVDGVRANYDHYLSHFIRNQYRQEIQVDNIRREYQRIRIEQYKKEQFLKQQQKKEEQKEQLKVRFNLSQIFQQPKTVRIKHSEETYFVLVKDDTTKISLKLIGDQVFLNQ